MRVSELMHTPAVTCRSGATIGEVARQMRDRNVGSVVVVDDIGYLAGIVTDRDVALRGVAEGRPGEEPVDEIMTRNVATVPARADVADAAALMVKRRVRRLPVVDDAGAPHGMLALDDLVRQLGHDADAVADTVMIQAADLPGGP